MQGATRIEVKKDDYLEAGKRLTQAAVSRLQGNCAICETQDTALYLLHISLDNGETISSVVCHECAKNITVHQLFVTTIEKLISVAKSKNATLQ